MKPKPAFLVGFLAGLRAATPPAAIAWSIKSGRLKLPAPLSWGGLTPLVALNTVFAAAELVGDQLPNTPARTNLAGVSARLVSGGLSGLCLGAAAKDSLVKSTALGALGSMAGCFGGYYLRRTLTHRLSLKDFLVALAEDSITLLGTALVLHRASHSQLNPTPQRSNP